MHRTAKIATWPRCVQHPSACHLRSIIGLASVNATPPRMEAQIPQSPLLSLPLELRMMVYHHTFTPIPYFHRHTTARSLEPTSLFQVCHLIRSEANAAFYDTLDDPAVDLMCWQPAPRMQAPCAVDDGNWNGLRAIFNGLWRYQ